MFGSSFQSAEILREYSYYLTNRELIRLAAVVELSCFSRTKGPLCGEMVCSISQVVRIFFQRERVMRTIMWASFIILFISNQISVRATQPECTPTLMIAMASSCVTWLELHMKWTVPRDLNLTQPYSSVIGQTTLSARMAVASPQGTTKRPSGRLSEL